MPYSVILYKLVAILTGVLHLVIQVIQVIQVYYTYSPSLL